MCVGGWGARTEDSRSDRKESERYRERSKKKGWENEESDGRMRK